ncbi:phospholipase D family protein, partial [Klebsiella pneumoniae]
MRKTTLLVLAAALCVPAFATAAPVLTAGFSPSDGRPALEIVLGAINNARQSIDVAAYSFSSNPVATALAGANRRGAALRAVADDKTNSPRYTAVTDL